jgi:hypothetical protein
MINKILGLLMVLVSLTSYSQSDSLAMYHDSINLNTSIVDGVDSITIHNYNNTVSGMYIDNNIKQINVNFTGDNTITKGKKSFSSNTTYSFAYTTEVINNELLQKTNIGYERLFISHIFNHSLTRNIKSDNFIGVGYGFKWKHVSLSYASMFENTIYNQTSSVNVLRHSVRGKFKYDNQLFSIIIEYYYQPNMIKSNDVIVYGSTKISLLQKNKLSFSITDVVNYRSLNKVKLMHTIGIGISYNLKITHKNLVD